MKKNCKFKSFLYVTFTERLKLFYFGTFYTHVNHISYQLISYYTQLIAFNEKLL